HQVLPLISAVALELPFKNNDPPWGSAPAQVVTEIRHQRGSAGAAAVAPVRVGNAGAVAPAALCVAGAVALGAVRPPVAIAVRARRVVTARLTNTTGAPVLATVRGYELCPPHCRPRMVGAEARRAFMVESVIDLAHDPTIHRPPVTYKGHTRQRPDPRRDRAVTASGLPESDQHLPVDPGRPRGSGGGHPVRLRHDRQLDGLHAGVPLRRPGLAATATRLLKGEIPEQILGGGDERRLPVISIIIIRVPGGDVLGLPVQAVYLFRGQILQRRAKPGLKLVTLDHDHS